MSRDTVACTASMPAARSASATSAWVESGCCWTSRRIAPWRSNFVRHPDHLGEQVDGECGLVGRDGQRRREAQRALAGGADTSPCSSARSTTGPAGRSSSTASSSPRPRTSPNCASAVRRNAEVARTCASRSSSIVVDDGAGGGAGDGVAAERRGVVARHEAGGRVVGDEQRADRQAVREPLRERDGVRARRRDAARRRMRRCARRRSAPRRGSAARRARRRARAPRRAPRRGSGCTPPSPCTGSSRIAAVCGPTCSASVSGVANTAPGTSGSNGARFAGWPVTESAPIVRPWNEPSSATTPLRPVALRAHLSAASTASAPELQKNACAPPKTSESRARAPPSARSSRGSRRARAGRAAPARPRAAPGGGGRG